MALRVPQDNRYTRWMFASALLGILLAAGPARAFNQNEPFELNWSAGGIRMTELNGHSESIHSVAPFPDGKHLMTADLRSLRVWDLTSGATKLVRTGEEALFAAAVSQDGRRLLVSEGKGHLLLLDAQTGGELKSILVDDWVRHLAFTPDGLRAVVVAHSDVRIVDLEAGVLLRTVSLIAPESQPGGDFIPDCIAVTADGRLAAALTEKKGRIYDLDTGAILNTWTEKKEGFSSCSVAFSPDGKTFLSSQRKKRILLRGIAKGEELAQFETEGEDSEQMGVTFSHDGRRVAAGTRQGLWVWDLSSGKALVRGGDRLLHPVLSHDGRLAFSKNSGAPVFTPGEPMNLSLIRGGAVSIVDAETGKETGPRLPTAMTAKMSVTGTSLSGYGINEQSLAVFNKAFKACFIGYDRGFEMMASCLKTMRAQALEAAPIPTQKQELTQGAYESLASFNARVAAAVAANVAVNENAMAEYEKKVSAWKLPLAALPVSFSMIFGAPELKNLAYDPETYAFTFDLAASHSNSGGFKLKLGLKAQIPNNEAEAFEQRLRRAAASVTFHVRDGNFSVEKVSILVPNDGPTPDFYTALPTDAVAARTLARVSVGDTAVKPTEAAPLDVRFGYAENPELVVKQRELAAARKKKAASDKIAALEEELRLISGAGAPTYNSDADEPVAARPEDAGAFAVVVGVESYQNSDLPKARFAERDALSMAKRLEALGVPPRNMKLLVGAGATRAKLAAVLEEWLPQRTSASSKVYFYFSGHGAPDAGSGNSYLVPWDGDPSLLKRTGYALSGLYTDLSKVPAARRLVVLDACFSGAGGRSLLAKGARPLVNTRETESGDITVLAAASANQITATLENQGHGLFTYHFLKSLGAGGRTASAVFADLKTKVEDDAARQSREQTPAFHGPDAPIP